MIREPIFVRDDDPTIVAYESAELAGGHYESFDVGEIRGWDSDARPLEVRGLSNDLVAFAPSTLPPEPKVLADLIRASLIRAGKPPAEDATLQQLMDLALIELSPGPQLPTWIYLAGLLVFAVIASLLVAAFVWSIRN